MSTLNVANISDGTDTVGTGYVVNGSAKAWVNFNGTGTTVIRDSFNITDIFDITTGQTRASFTNNMSDDAEFAMTCTASNSGGGSAFAIYAPNITAKSESSTGTIFTGLVSTGAAVDDAHVSVLINGDLA